MHFRTCVLACLLVAGTAANAWAAPANSEAAVLKADAAKAGPLAFTASGYKPGTVRHIVLLRFRDGLSADARRDLIAAFLSLKTRSLHDGRPVIASIETGPQISGEGADRGLEQAFVLTFNSEGDRNYFIGSPIVTTPGYFDPAHDAFKKTLIPALAPQGLVGFDYPVTDATPPSP